MAIDGRDRCGLLSTCLDGPGRHATINYRAATGVERAYESQRAARQTIAVCHALRSRQAAFTQQFDDVARAEGQRTERVGGVRQQQRARVIDANLRCITVDMAQDRQPATTLPDLPGGCDQVGSYHQVECQCSGLRAAIAQSIGDIEGRFITGTGHDRRNLKFKFGSAPLHAGQGQVVVAQAGRKGHIGPRVEACADAHESFNGEIAMIDFDQPFGIDQRYTGAGCCRDHRPITLLLAQGFRKLAGGRGQRQ